MGENSSIQQRDTRLLYWQPKEPARIGVSQTLCEYKNPHDHSSTECMGDVFSNHESQSRCILHDKSISKDRELFLKALREKVRQDTESSTQVINLAGIVFPNGVSPNDLIDGRRLSKAVSLADCEFNEEVDFEDAPFSNGAIFDYAKFKKAAHFMRTRFQNSVSFVHTEFGEASSFDGAQFSGTTDFRDAIFKAVASFDEKAEFHGPSFFVDTHFENESNFMDAIFHQHANFMRAQFGGVCYFTSARFVGDAKFDGAQFHGTTSFLDAQFGGNVSFRTTRSARKDSGALETQAASFSKNRNTNFQQTTFRKVVVFQGVDFPKDNDPGKVSFNGLKFDKPESVLFQDINLSRTSLLETDLREIHFLNITWACPSLRQWPWPWRRSFKMVFDDPRAGRPDKKNDRGHHHQVAELYRQLRMNLEERRQEIEAADFYVGQMDMLSQNQQLQADYRKLLPLYRHFALYGQSHVRPLLLYGILALVFCFAYLAGGIKSGGAVIHRPWFDFWFLADGSFWKDWAETLFLAGTTGPLLRQDLQVLSPWLRLVQYLNTLSNVLFLALAVIALRRQFKR